MSDLISRRDVLNAPLKLTYDGMEWIPVYHIEELPSVESVIRCQDCKHMIINEKHEAKPMICCFTKMCGTTEPDWFCADGERRDDE